MMECYQSKAGAMSTVFMMSVRALLVMVYHVMLAIDVSTLNVPCYPI